MEGIPQIGLSLDDADDLTKLLNRLGAEARLATRTEMQKCCRPVMIWVIEDHRLAPEIVQS